MKHRDRVILALDHEEADRCPFPASFTPEFAARLREELEREVLARLRTLGKGGEGKRGQETAPASGGARRRSPGTCEPATADHPSPAQPRPPRHSS